MATSYAKLLRENEELRERLNTRRSGNEIATATLPGRDRHNQGGQTMSRPERQTTGLKIKPQAGGNVSAPEDTLAGEAPIAATTPQKYISPYAERLEALYSELENSEFDYNKQEDPNWQAMRKEYLLAADRTADDVLTKASVNTGGRASSYAVMAASQAANDVRASLSQAELDLYDQAYNRYYQEYSKKLQDLQNLQQQDADNYDHWLTEETLAQEQKDKAYDDLVTLITHTGHTPSEEELAAADMSAEEAASWKSYYQTQMAMAQSSGGGGGSGGSGYNSWVAEQQQMLNDKYGAGLVVDGIWGSKTEAAYNKYIVNGSAGTATKTYNNGMTADQISIAAQNYYLQNPSVKLDSRTLDGWLVNNGYTGESSKAFKAYLQALGATYSGQH